MALGSLKGVAFGTSRPVWTRGSMSSPLGSLKASQGGADGEHPLALLSTASSRNRRGAPV
eukprot:7184617-Pyramimonas_sp.AAC.1